MNDLTVREVWETIPENKQNRIADFIALGGAFYMSIFDDLTEVQKKVVLFLISKSKC